MVPSSLPMVTVIMPVLNEAAFIRHSLGAVLQQDYPADHLEILVIDGGSIDGTQSIVQKMLADRPASHLLDNPRRMQAAALNLGISKAQGDVIIRVDGHTVIAPDYVQQCVYYLTESKADNVGGLMRPQGNTFVGKGVALAISSPFGSGDAKFHYSEREQYVDSVYMGAYWRRNLEQIGGYDETFWINEDYELNYRLRQTGGKILLNPTIRSIYTPRSSLSALWQQYFRYGQGKVHTLQKHPKSLRWRQAVPPVFVGTFLGTLMGGLFWKPFQFLFGLLAGCYLLANLVASTIVARRGGWRYFPVLPLVFATIHFAWGMGFWFGAVQTLLRPKQ